jgi:hypothetical protein
MEPRIEAVLPVVEPDLPRMRTLVRSLDRFFPELDTCWVLTPRDSVDAVRAVAAGSRYRVLPEDEVVPELARAKSFDRIAALVGDRGLVSGWYRQQLIKLAAAELVGTDFYLTLDSDVICTRPTTVADLVRDGRGVCEGRQDGKHDEWYAWAERVLGVESRRTQHGVTPAVLAKAGVGALAEHLAERAGADRTWRGYLMRNTPWTEYALYTTYLEHAGIYDRHHLRLGEGALYGNCVWSPEQYEGWEPSGEFHFTVVQSTAGVEPEEIAGRVERLLAPAHA